MKDVLDDNFAVKLKECMQALNSEIQWCYANPRREDTTQEFRAGFIKGLIQAKDLLLAVAGLSGVVIDNVPEPPERA